jgi:hypothetical protein
MKCTGELVVTGGMSTDTRCLYDRLLVIPYSGLSTNFTSDRNGLFGRVKSSGCTTSLSMICAVALTYMCMWALFYVSKADCAIQYIQ